MSSVTKVGESGAGVLYRAGAFPVLILSGSNHDMGVQYGSLTRDDMQSTWDVLVEPGRKKDAISDDDVRR
jgi:hypothetical protein